MFTWARTWLVFVATIWRMSQNYRCVIFNALILRRRTIISCNTTIFLISSLWWWIHNNQLEIINKFLWIILIFSVFYSGVNDEVGIFLDLLLNSYLEYVTLSLIYGNVTSLETTFNKISELWSVFKILPNK